LLRTRKVPRCFKLTEGNYHDPVTGKIFTEYTVIIAIATSGNSNKGELFQGNVYAKETIDELNKQPKNWKDLMTSTHPS
jgi:peptidyl-prolyl cis-trans isomerase-like 2